MVCYSSTQSWYIIKINGTSFTATATKILGLEGGNTQKFKTLSLSLGQKGYNSLSFWKKNNFFKKSFNFCTVPQVSKHWFSQTYLNNKNTPALLYSVTSCRRITAAICIIVAEQGNVPSSKVQPDLGYYRRETNKHQNVAQRSIYMFPIPFRSNISGASEKRLCLTFQQHLCSTMRQHHLRAEWEENQTLCGSAGPGMSTEEQLWTMCMKFKNFRPINWHPPLEEGQGLDWNCSEMVCIWI